MKKSNITFELCIALAMFCVSGYLFLNNVSVRTVFYPLRFAGQRMNGGLVIVPFIIGVIWFFINTESVWPKVTMALGLLIIIASVIAGTTFHFYQTSLFTYLLMVGGLFGGAAMLLKVLFLDITKKKK